MAAGKVQLRWRVTSPTRDAQVKLCVVCYLIVLRMAAKVAELFFISLFAFTDVTKLS